MEITISLLQISIVLVVSLIGAFVVYVLGRIQGEENMIRILNSLGVHIPNHILARIKINDIKAEDKRPTKSNWSYFGLSGGRKLRNTDSSEDLTSEEIFEQARDNR